jgi:RNA polymerase sigma-B factor
MGTSGSKVETKELLALYRETQDPSVTERLVVDHLSLVKRLCWRFHSSGEPQEDLIQVGTIGLIKAIREFDPELGDSFISFAVPVIVGEIKNYFRDHGWAVKMPRKLQSQKLAVDRAARDLIQRLGHTPTVPEIAEDTGLSIEEVSETFEMERFGKPLSLDNQYESDDSDDASSIADYLGDLDPDLEGLADRVDLTLALEGVDSREQAIIYLKFYSGLSQSAIAQKLGISQMHVSRLQRSALNKLKSSLVKQASP